MLTLVRWTYVVCTLIQFNFIYIQLYPEPLTIRVDTLHLAANCCVAATVE